MISEFGSSRGVRSLKQWLAHNLLSIAIMGWRRSSSRWVSGAKTVPTRVGRTSEVTNDLFESPKYLQFTLAPGIVPICWAGIAPSKATGEYSPLKMSVIYVGHGTPPPPQKIW